MTEPEENRRAKVVELLRDSLGYLERRITSVDNRSSILFAVLAALLAASVILATRTNIGPNLAAANPFLGAMLVGFLILGSLALMLLVQTIRPTDWFLGLKATTQDLEDVKQYVMWPKAGFPKNPKDYTDRLELVGLAEVERNYERAHFIALQLVREKYRFYRWAALSIKLLIIWGIVSAAVFVVLTLF